MMCTIKKASNNLLKFYLQKVSVGNLVKFSSAKHLHYTLVKVHNCELFSSSHICQYPSLKSRVENSFPANSVTISWMMGIVRCSCLMALFRSWDQDTILVIHLSFPPQDYWPSRWAGQLSAGPQTLRSVQMYVVTCKRMMFHK